ncbi:uncharacterized protein EI90DRAFT_2996148 [Cantharellus anzutake]|uniref:uncharacterized protein n=1 Tax=Cantharellus anzutake TaxID=1750568 RepID=UPI0019071BAB|nr:uncharacterized protein EI90DRAFT_2996148 [Cantharellus anzutake]KAF8331025.1 hypothetical protein EI90DRAFT_2996148 [Cantharellus anzutake]
MPPDEKMGDVQYSSTLLGERRPILRDDQVEKVIQLSKNSHLCWEHALEQAEGMADHKAWSGLFCGILSRLSMCLAKADVKVIPETKLASIVESLGDVERTECKDLIADALRQRKWDPLIRYAYVKLRLAEPNGRFLHYYYNELEVEKDLAAAYRVRFIGSAPLSFIRHLDRIDREESNLNELRYAKSISIVQSSGTGKSRMLTEVGSRIFTLPICLRPPGSLGYPLADRPVYNYFDELKTHNYSSIGAVSGIAGFFAAAHETMLASLEGILGEGNCTRKEVLGRWHQGMEGKGIRSFRVKFFERVIERAKELQKKYGVEPRKYPKLDESKGEKGGPIALARIYYEKDAKKAVENLIRFIQTLTSDPDPLCITYFDEAHELGMWLWFMLGLLQNQSDSVRMWYVFMGTKLTSLAPRPQDVFPTRIREKRRRLEPPYFALGFDQHASEQAENSTPVKMGHFETLEHISQYGRPMWRAMLPRSGSDELINIAAYKLTTADVGGFDATNKNHVFAVLSQRLCLDIVLMSTGAAELAERSVSHHMRLLTGLSAGNAILYTHSPSEPILALGAARLLYHPHAPKERLSSVLETLSTDLCLAGLVEKGSMGELAARFLLLTARDFTAPIDKKRHRNLLKPVRLLDVLQILFGNNDWCDQSLKTAFRDAFVNFTHWTATKNVLPETPSRKLLSNLWARGAILQCCINQTSIDFLCPVYFGSVEPGAIFDCDQLSGLVVQVKNKTKEGDTDARNGNLRPVGIIRDPKNPLPYLALLMELGTESRHRGGGLIKHSPPQHSQPSQYKRLTEEYQRALDGLSRHREQDSKNTKHSKELEADVQAKELKKDFYKRHLISARGAGSKTYGILETAGIQKEFKDFVSIVVPQESFYEDEIAQMWPDPVGDDDDSQARWLADYVLDNEG